MSENYVVLEIASVHPDPNQPRKNFPSKDIARLSRSINAVGQLQPIIVNPNDDGHVLEDGQMRLEALKKLGVKTVKAIVRERNGEEAVEKFMDQTVINDVRFGMGIEDTARAYQKSMDEGKSPYQVAEAHGKTERTIEKEISLLNLPTKCHQALDNGSLTKAVAYKLADMSHEFPPTGDGSIEEAFEKILGAKDVTSAIKKLETWAKKTRGDSTDTEDAKDNGTHADRKKAGQALNRFLKSCQTMMEKLDDPAWMQNACMGMAGKENYMELIKDTAETAVKCGKLVKDGLETYNANVTV